MTEGHRIIGTAGHIDHGKTSLVRALTGTDLDRLPEERSRGITIALGFVHHPLPSGRIVSFVDVPGHERLVRTMISGATGLDAVMLCISAAEGVMPQTKEHLDILGLLGCEQGLIALTMCDLVDDETLELAQMEVEELVEGTFLEKAPIICTSAVEPANELADLVEALEQLNWAPRTVSGPFRLPVDRAFVQHGFGTVVTGTIRSGCVVDGTEVRIMPEGTKARVRGMQVHGNDVKRAENGSRCALNLAGVERDDLARGMVITEQGLEPSSILDTRIRLLEHAPDLKDGQRVRLLVGTSEVMASCTIISTRPPGLPEVESSRVTAGREALVQLRTEAPLVCLPRDRFVLRRESPVDTLGGGVVLDAWSKRIRKRDKAAQMTHLKSIESGLSGAYLKRAGRAGIPVERAVIYGDSDLGIRLGNRLFHPTIVSEMTDELTEWLAEWHRSNPLVPGCPRREVHTGGLPHWDKRAFEDLIQGAIDRERMIPDGPRLRLNGFEIRLDSAQQARLDALIGELRALGCATPKIDELMERDPDLIPLLMNRGQLQRVGERLIDRTVLHRLVQDVTDYLVEHSTMGPSAFKEITGLSRRHAIPLLEWLDQQGITRRQDDYRVLRDG